MLRVTVVEVAAQRAQAVRHQHDRAAGRRFDFLTNAVYPLSNQVLAVDNRSAARCSEAANSRTQRCEAFERAGVSRVLAEPTLTAISGEAANFTAGGEIPIPKSQSCDTPSAGGQTDLHRSASSSSLTASRLNFTPVVLSESRISLRVSTEVTELDYENQLRFDTVNVPGMKVRKSDDDASSCPPARR